jgi:hypothetical protein
MSTNFYQTTVYFVECDEIRPGGEPCPTQGDECSTPEAAERAARYAGWLEINGRWMCPWCRLDLRRSK